MKDPAMNHARSLLVPALLLLLVACASSGSKQPDWINGTSSQYPEQTYLIGRGQSENRGIAQDRARADLAKIFEVRINEQSTDTVTYQGTTDTEGAQNNQLSSAASREVRTHTKQIIQGIRIAELWQDPESGQYHALAVLNRNQAANDLRQAILQQDRATEREIALAKQQGDLFNQIGHASRALDLQQSRYSEQRMLKIIDPTGIGVPPVYNLAVLQTDRDSLLQRVSIHAQVKNNSITGLDGIVEGAIANAGFTSTPLKQANYLLDTDLQVHSFRDDKGWYWYRGSLQIDLRAASSGKSIGNHRWDIKVSAVNSDTALQRVRDAVNNTLNRELRNVIVAFGSAER
jgi:hypothetical protein